APDGGLDGLDLFLELVPDVNPAVTRAGNKPGQHHALDYQVRCAAEQLAVLERARLALVRIADDVLDVRWFSADERPLQVRAKAGPAHTAQVGYLQRVEDTIGVEGLVLHLSQEPLDRFVGRPAVVGVNLPAERTVPGVLRCERLPHDHRAQTRDILLFGQSAE